MKKINIFRHFDFKNVSENPEINTSHGSKDTKDAISNDAKIIEIRRCFQGQTQGQTKVNK